jgi:hypothetical protein
MEFFKKCPTECAFFDYVTPATFKAVGFSGKKYQKIAYKSKRKKNNGKKYPNEMNHALTINYLFDFRNWRQSRKLVLFRKGKRFHTGILPNTKQREYVPIKGKSYREVI